MNLSQRALLLMRVRLYDIVPARSPFSAHFMRKKNLMCRLTAVVVRMFVRPIATVVDLVTHLPLTDAAAVPTLELVRSTRGSLCGGDMRTQQINSRSSRKPPHISHLHAPLSPLFPHRGDSETTSQSQVPVQTGCQHAGLMITNCCKAFS